MMGKHTFLLGLRQQNEPHVMEGSESVSVAMRHSLAVERELGPVQNDTCSQVYSPNTHSAPAGRSGMGHHSR